MFEGEAFDLPDGQGGVVEVAHAFLGAWMVADAAGDPGLGIGAQDDFHGLRGLAVGDEPQVVGDVLVSGAAVHAGRGDAVEVAQGPVALELERAWPVLVGVVPHRLHPMPGQVEARAMAAGAGQDERVEACRPGLIHGRFQVDQVLLEPGVAAGLEQVRADRDWPQAVGDQVREIAGVGPATETERHLALQLLGHQMSQGQGDGMQRPPRQVHHLLVGGEHRPVVHHLQRVGELQAEGVLPPLGQLGQGLDHGHGVVPLGVVAERLVRHRDVEAQRVIEDAAQPLRP